MEQSFVDARLHTAQIEAVALSRKKLGQPIKWVICHICCHDLAAQCAKALSIYSFVSQFKVAIEAIASFPGPDQLSVACSEVAMEKGSLVPRPAQELGNEARKKVGPR